MGKLAIMSDLHVDINQLGDVELTQLINVLLEKKVTRLHLAGDTANDVSIVLAVIEFIEKSGILVTFNFGNHELPQLSVREMEEYPDPHFLNQQVLDLNQELSLLAVNGWYDYSFGVAQSDEKHLAAKNLYWYDRLIEREASDNDVTEMILTRLEQVLTAHAETGKKLIMATHFVPRQEFIVTQQGRYARWNQLNAFLGTEKMGRLLAKFPHIQQVVFGHTHRKFYDEEVDGIIYSARPLGYFYEWGITRDFMLKEGLMTTYNPMKVRGILKDHREEFAAYRLASLSQEFARSLTLIEY